MQIVVSKKIAVTIVYNEINTISNNKIRYISYVIEEKHLDDKFQ